MGICEKIDEIFGPGSAQELSEMDSETLKATFSPKVRSKLVNHLRKGKGPVAEGFRGEFISVGKLLDDSKPYHDFDAYLDEQEKDGVWGTDKETAAAGELFGVNQVVTCIKNGETQTPFCLYRAENPKALTFHLYCSNNSHYFIDKSNPSQTNGGNNCFYNAQALLLQQGVRKEMGFKPQPQVSVSPHGIFNQEADIIAHQKALEKAIIRQSKPSDLMAVAIKEKERIANLDPLIQEQIAKDYRYALQLAAEEINHSFRR